MPKDFVEGAEIYADEKTLCGGHDPAGVRRPSEKPSWSSSLVTLQMTGAFTVTALAHPHHPRGNGPIRITASGDTTMKKRG